MNTKREQTARYRVGAGAGFLAALMLAGCVTVGQPFASNKVSMIQLGQTKQADIEQMFGNPFRTGIEDGDVTWTYVHYQLKVIGPEQTQDLYVRFKSDGTVKSYSFNSNAPDESPKKP